MVKRILVIGLVFLLLFSSVVPISFGYNINLSDKSMIVIHKFDNCKNPELIDSCNKDEVFDKCSNLDSELQTNLSENLGFNTLNNGDPFDGYTLFGPEYSKYTYLLNMDGKIVHTWKSDYIQGLAAYLLENGDLLRLDLPYSNPRFSEGGVAGRVEKFDNKSNLLWEFEYSNDQHCLHHDIEPLPNGNILMIAWEVKTPDEAIAAGRNPNNVGYIYPDHIIEVKPNGSSGGDIVWEWHIWDHLIQDFDPTKDNYGVVADHPELIDINYCKYPNSPDWNHVNSVDYNGEFDQILLSVKHFDEIWVIDHSTTTEEAAGHIGGRSGKGGDILYRWGNPQAYSAGTASDRKYFEQHGAIWVEKGYPGEDNILVFNNGVGRAYTSVDEIIPPVDDNGNYFYTLGEAYGPDEQIWIYTKDDLNSWTLSSVQRLPNGNTLICSGNQGLFLEVTPEKEIVWQYRNILPNPFANGVARIFRYSKDYPGIPERKSKSINLNGNDLNIEYEPNHGTFNPNFENIEGNIIYVDDDGTADYINIQDAIDNSSEGDTIFVYNGTYYENIIVDKSVYLIGGNKEGTIIDGQKNGTTLSIVADGCLVSNFSLFNCEEQINQNWGDAVIKIYGVNDVIVRDNFLNAGDVQTSSYVNYGAIDIDGCSDYKIINNYVIQNSPESYTIGIALHDNSSNNGISGNDVSYFNFGFCVIDDGNNRDNTISENHFHQNRFGISTGDGYNEILNNTVEYNTEVGINIQNGYHYVISGNIIQFNGGSDKFFCGIELMGDLSNNNNIVSDNVISNNKPCGLQTEYSHGNVITRNNFINNNGESGTLERWWGNAYFHIQDGFFNKDTFKGNYWSDSLGVFPKIIHGILEVIPHTFTMNWINIDWRPAKEPYDI
jgi:hypothetical protein